MANLPPDIRAYLSNIGRKGGRAGTGASKARNHRTAVRAGKLGGRPRTYPPCPLQNDGTHRWKNGVCACGCVRILYTIDNSKNHNSGQAGSAGESVDSIV